MKNFAVGKARLSQHCMNDVAEQSLFSQCVKSRASQWKHSPCQTDPRVGRPALPQLLIFSIALLKAELPKVPAEITLAQTPRPCISVWRSHSERVGHSWAALLFLNLCFVLRFPAVEMRTIRLLQNLLGCVDFHRRLLSHLVYKSTGAVWLCWGNLALKSSLQLLDCVVCPPGGRE